MKVYDDSCLKQEKSTLKDELRACEYCTDTIGAHNKCRKEVAIESRKRARACGIRG